jgi:hypothetical protein
VQGVTEGQQISAALTGNPTEQNGNNTTATAPSPPMGHLQDVTNSNASPTSASATAGVLNGISPVESQLDQQPLDIQAIQPDPSAHNLPLRKVNPQQPTIPGRTRLIFPC